MIIYRPYPRIIGREKQQSTNFSCSHIPILRYHTTKQLIEKYDNYKYVIIFSILKLSNLINIKTVYIKNEKCILTLL